VRDGLPFGLARDCEQHVGFRFGGPKPAQKRPAQVDGLTLSAFFDEQRQQVTVQVDAVSELDQAVGASSLHGAPRQRQRCGVVDVATHG
jgi:hypothetical protein